MNSIRDRLFSRLRQPLPGLEAQLRLAHPDRIRNVRERKIPDDARISSVLVLLYPTDTDVHFPLIVRPDYPGVHSGQVGLPGGKQEPEDSSLSVTALRETQEEVGIHPSSIELLGPLTPLYIPPSGFLVHPFVGWLGRSPEFTTDPTEVASLFEVPVSRLIDPNAVSEERIRLQNGLQLTTPAFRFNDRIVWGATAMILSEFGEVWKQALDPTPY
jgi:8-oxo-dGTP pyrophosphatase MutT (NUDIX family)